MRTFFLLILSWPLFCFRILVKIFANWRISSTKIGEIFFVVAILLPTFFSFFSGFLQRYITWRFVELFDKSSKCLPFFQIFIEKGNTLIHRGAQNTTETGCVSVTLRGSTLRYLVVLLTDITSCLPKI